MSETFLLDHSALAADPKFAGFARELGAQARIDSPGSFNAYCRRACQLWREQFGAAASGATTTAQFTGLLERIGRGGEGIIPTSWGGVVVTLHEHPRVEKFLVVRQGGYLALEKHELKDERLEVREGAGLFLQRRTDGQPLVVQALAPGDEFHLTPGQEHCLIGTENLLVFERSIDPKGMDQDLIFLYEPDASS